MTFSHRAQAQPTSASTGDCATKHGNITKSSDYNIVCQYVCCSISFQESCIHSHKSNPRGADPHAPHNRPQRPQRRRPLPAAVSSGSISATQASSSPTPDRLQCRNVAYQLSRYRHPSGNFSFAVRAPTADTTEPHKQPDHVFCMAHINDQDAAAMRVRFFQSAVSIR